VATVRLPLDAVEAVVVEVLALDRLWRSLLVCSWSLGCHPWYLSTETQGFDDASRSGQCFLLCGGRAMLQDSSTVRRHGMVLSFD